MQQNWPISDILDVAADLSCGDVAVLCEIDGFGGHISRSRIHTFMKQYLQNNHTFAGYAPKQTRFKLGDSYFTFNGDWSEEVDEIIRDMLDKGLLQLTTSGHIKPTSFGRAVSAFLRL